MAVVEHTIELAGVPVFYREAVSIGPTPVYLHSAPTSSDDWLPFLEVTGGLAADLIGFGRSGKGGHLDYTLEGHVAFLEAFMRATGVDEIVLIGHGWGAAVAAAFAQRHAERVHRLVMIDAVALLSAFQWPKPLRRVRRAGIGELVMGSITRGLLARGLRAGVSRPETWTEERIDAVWEQFDQGTQRAILRLLRSSSPAELARAGAQLDQLAMPTLIAWGEADPWLAPALAPALAQQLPEAELEMVPGAGHWPWLDSPAVIERVAAFLEASP